MSLWEKKKHHSGRREYLEDFQRTASGEFVYMGATYVFDGTPERRRRGLLLAWGPGAVMAVLSVIPGCLNPERMPAAVLTLLPYVLMLLSAACTLWALGRLCFSRDPLRAYVYAGTVEALPRRAVFTAIFAGIALLCMVIDSAIRGTLGTPAALLLCLLDLMVAACALLLRKLIRGMHWNEESRD